MKVNALPEEQRDAEVRRQRFQRFNLLSPLRETEKQAVSYWLFLPSDYDPGAKKKWPLLLFLHGYGAASTDLDKVKSVGPPKTLDDPDKAKDWPFITVSPQCPGDSAWAWRPLQLAALLDELEKHLAIDADRVYVTGPSMGGIGTWALLYHLPGRFAAGVPVSGGFSPEAARRFVDTPIWAFHGGKDNITPLPLAEEMVDAVRSAGGRHVELTVYPDAGHDAWTEAYDDPKLYDWLLKQRRPPREATTRSGNE